MTVLRWGSATDVGMVRESNQDSMLTAEPLFAVADGMGGHQGGEVASATALEILQKSFVEHTREDLLEAVRRANAKVWDRAQLDNTLHGMGTTLTAAARVSDGTDDSEVLAVINVGDSRGYLFRDGELSQVTTDHSLVEEMIRAGEISAEEAETHPRRNIVTRALGVEPTVEVDIDLLSPQPGDRVLLCSDGLTRELTDDQIAAILRRLKNPQEAAKELVAQAKAHGGADNITVVIVDVEADEEDQAALPPTSTAAPEKGRRRRSGGRKTGAHPHHRAGRITFRMVMFFAAIAGLLFIAAGSVVWYARSSYYVGLEGEQVVIYQGRPEPVLWFDKTLAARTSVSTADVLPGDIPRLRDGVTQPSLRDSHRFITNLTDQALAARAAANPGIATPEATGIPTSTTTVP